MVNKEIERESRKRAGVVEGGGDERPDIPVVLIFSASCQSIVRSTHVLPKTGNTINFLSASFRLVPAGDMLIPPFVFSFEQIGADLTSRVTAISISHRLPA